MRNYLNNRTLPRLVRGNAGEILALTALIGGLVMGAVTPW